MPEIIVRVVVPLANGRVRVDVRAEGDADSTAEVKEVPNVAVEEHSAQTVTVVAQSRPQVVTVVVTVLACSCGRALMSEGLIED